MTDEGAPFIPAEWATALYEYARDAEADSRAMLYGWTDDQRQRFMDACTPEMFWPSATDREAVSGLVADIETRLTVRGVECFPNRMVKCSQCGQSVQAGAPSEDCCPAIRDEPAPVWVRAFYAEHGVWPCEW